MFDLGQEGQSCCPSCPIGDVVEQETDNHHQSQSQAVINTISDPATSVQNSIMTVNLFYKSTAHSASAASPSSVGKRARCLADTLSDCSLLEKLSRGLTKPRVLRLLLNY